MKKVSLVLVCAFAMVFAVSCAKKATPELCAQACAKKVELAPKPVVENPVDKVAAAFRAEEDALAAEEGNAMAEIQAACDTAAANLTKEEEKAAAVAKCDADKAAKATELAPRKEELAAKKAAAMDAAVKAKAEADKKAAEQLEADKTACAEECVNGRFTEVKVNCQIAATTVEEFDACK
ncbi:MAG TPA: hypothetical protein PKK50_08495 [Myxococcota bacterium]|nr:hypothetical protein [Myxococcota bacterium]